MVVLRCRRRQKRQQLQPPEDASETDPFICNKLRESNKPQSNNIHLQKIPMTEIRGGGKANSSPRPPPVPNRPISYTPSTADSLNTLNNVNFDSARNYGSAADELENMGTFREPIQIPEFLTNVDVEKSPATGRAPLPAPPLEKQPLLQKSPGWDPNNLNYPEGEI